MEEFTFIAALSCDTQQDLHNSFYLPNINKAAIRFTCFGSLVDNPSCVSDAWHGIATFEWNDAGKLVSMNMFGSGEDSLTIALSACMADKKTDEMMKPSKAM